ncbi:MAG: ribokinase [Anaerolineales bacterium]|nr:ribokinase [Anaerolineales bacterium]MCB0029743.1 ribokinase [Anaerolineales bacterium]
MSIIVLGSINTVLLSQVEQLPGPGETFTSHSFSHFPGGKGANQAVAAARLGLASHLISRVGNDNFGPHLTKLLHKQSIDVSNVGRDDKTPTGVAQRFVAADGETITVITPGANHRIGRAELAALDKLAPVARILVLSLDIPIETILMAARFGAQYGLTVILDPNPVGEIPDELWDLVDVLTPDGAAASRLVGFPVESAEAAQHAAELLYGHGPRQIVLNRWGLGTHVVNATDSRALLPYPNMPLDSSIASDAFTGALAAGFASGLSFIEAVHWGITASSIAMTRPHGLNTLPTRAELEMLLATYQPDPFQ